MKIKYLLPLAVIFAFMLSTPVHAGDTERYPECKYCGMYRKYLKSSRMIVEHRDGSLTGTCSINCTAIDYIVDLDNFPVSILVGDYKTKRLIDAEKACWVIGGNKPGVMTRRAKWAFKDKRDALNFIGRHGGELATFDQVMSASYEDLYGNIKN